MPPRFPRFYKLVVLLVLLMAPSALLHAEERPIDIDADIIHYAPDNKVTAKGAVQVVYRELIISAEEMAADLDANTALFPGAVTLTDKGETIHGESLSLNLKTREWKFENASATLSTNFLKTAQSPLFVKGQSLNGSSKLVGLNGCDLTSCNLDHPHFDIKAKTMTIYPGDKIVAKKVAFIVGDHEIFQLPQFVVPLSKDHSQLEMPQVGQSATEGMFVKTNYNYVAGKSQHGALKFDVTEKQGVGAGIEHNYSLWGGAGIIYLHDFFGAGQQTGRIQHTQKLGDTQLKLMADFRNNSYQYAPDWRAHNLILNLNRDLKSSNTSLSINTSGVSGAGSSDNLVSSLQHHQILGNRTQGDLVLDFTRSLVTSSGTTPTTTDDMELNSRMELRNRFPNFDFTLSANKRFDPDGSKYEDYYSGVQRLPEALFMTDSSRLKAAPLNWMPMRLQVGYGTYMEQPTNIQTTRGLLQLDLPGKELNWGQTKLNVSGGLRQTVYGDNTAQYVISENLALTHRLGKSSEAGITYYSQKPNGYSPFRFDYTTPYKVSTARVKWETSPKFNLSLGTGYDFLSSPEYRWQDMIVRANINPSKALSFSTATGYNLNDSRVRSITGRLKLNLKNGFELDTGARWDFYGGSSRTGIKTHLKTPLGKNWKVEAFIGSDGYVNSYTDIMITRDLHCWEASVIYVNEGGWQSQKGIRFTISLKAFPFQQRFGIGKFGQSLDTDLGEIY